MKDRLLTDGEVAERLGYSLSWLRGALREGPSRKRNEDSIDIREIDCFDAGGQRRWSEQSLEKLIQEATEKEKKKHGI